MGVFTPTSFYKKPICNYKEYKNMQNIKGNLFNQSADAICITTNGFVKSNGECVMGKGCAQEATHRWHGIAQVLGGLLKKHGNHVLMMQETPNYQVLSFPVKPVFNIFNGNNAVGHMASRFKIGEKIPGWACKADVKIIEQSARELLELANTHNWNKVIIPRPGCGAGELNWQEVEPILQNILDDRFYAITF